MGKCVTGYEGINMSFKKYFMSFVCALAIATFGGTAYAANYYVSTTGSDTADGSKKAPFRTISKAVSIDLEPGDVVWVRPGVYEESVRIPRNASGSAGKRVTLISGQKGAAKIVPPTGKPGIQSFANHFNIKGFEVIGGALGLEMSHHVTISNNIVHGSRNGGISAHRSEFVIIENNITYENASHSAASGIVIHVPQNVSGDTTTKGYRNIVRNNVSYNNVQTHSGSTDGNGIIFDDFLLRNLTANGDGDKYRKNASWMKPYNYPGLIENNITFGNGSAGIRVYATDNIMIRNNVAWHNGTDIEHKAKTGKTWLGELQNMSGSNNKWVNNIGVSSYAIHPDAAGISSVSFKDWPSKNVKWVNNLTYTDGNPTSQSAKVTVGVDTMIDNKLGVDPQFLNAPRNFVFKKSSPAANGGTLKYGSSVTDIYGGRRVKGVIDLGAKEHY